MHYQHDMMHCSQDQCQRKDQCYRYWLGKEIKNAGYQYASFFYPQKPITDNKCKYFINKKNYG